MKNRQWDIAFTLSPINSIYAKEQGYKYIARMYPDSPYYEAGLMVHKDSSIKSIDDIKPSTIVALGAFNSASSFYMPVYTLYGKTISVTTGHKGAEIRDLVKTKKVDVGSAAIGEIQDDSSLRLIDVSRALPGSGVYVSPKLSTNDQESLTKVILSAPDSAKVYEKANYGSIDKDGQALLEPDYTEFKKLMDRVDAITICSNFAKNPVNLFCPTGFKPYEIIGKVNGTKLQAGKYILTVVGQDAQIYLVSLSENIFNELTNGGQLDALQGKEINAKVIGQPQKTKQGLLANVTQSQQIKITE
jgi:serine/threonine-protein kinase